MHKLKIITSTTRPGRKGPAVSEWVLEVSKQFPDYETEILDLHTLALPLFDEPEHPRMRKYQHEHTHRWSRAIDEADAIIIVTAEYNFGMPAPLKNALDYLVHEWSSKPVAFVSYGGQSGGLRSVQMTKLVVTALKMMPIPEAVAIPFFTKYINEEGKFVADESLNKSAQAMFTELLRWTAALKPLRTKQ